MKKKLFVSVPMKGRKTENIIRDIEKMRKVAEAIFGEELELIDSYIEEDPPEGCNIPVWYMGKSVQLMGQADYFIGISNWLPAFRGCELERKIAEAYGIPTTYVNIYHLCPDIMEIDREFQETEFRETVMPKTC